MQKRKSMTFRKAILIIFKTLYLIITLTSCEEYQPENWSVYLPGTGTYSSPRLTDLNKDGILDIIMGAGGKEEVYSDTAIIALDGRNGTLIWKLPGHNQYVGSAQFKDVTGDEINDVFIGGRWAQLTAINGATGQALWTFFSGRKTPDAAYAGWYNFTTPQFIPDKDGDGLDDLIIANGGNPLAPPNDLNRPAGRILVISSKTGKILANVQVPDGKETYMSVVCSPVQKNSNINVLFGTGGETIGGHLYRTTLNDIMKGDISGAKVLATSYEKGFVASPVLVDVNSDHIHDIIVNAVDGRMMAISGANDSLLWQVYFPGTEAYTIPAVGYFNKDDIPDLFANFAIGVFPALTKSVRFMVSGKTGKVEYTDTIRAFQYASPVAADLDNDGWDEVAVNTSEVKRKQFENVYFSYLQVLDFVHNKNYSIGDTLQATNLASTPWIDDMDGDHHLDIVYSAVNFNNVNFDLQRPLGLWVATYKTGFPKKKPVRWGAFMGSDYTGIVNKK
jgi:hypothetical protein